MKKHPTSVEGFDGSLEELAERVCRMRYDRTAEFFACCAEELRHQSNQDLKVGRTQLAILLTQAWGIANVLRAQFEKLFSLCKPHMQGELAGES